MAQIELTQTAIVAVTFADRTYKMCATHFFNLGGECDSYVALDELAECYHCRRDAWKAAEKQIEEVAALVVLSGGSWEAHSAAVETLAMLLHRTMPLRSIELTYDYAVFRMTL